MISFRPLSHALRKVARTPSPDIETVAERWEIAPAVTRYVPAAKFLPGQLDRIRGTEFGPPGDVIRDFQGDFETRQDATLGFRLHGADLVDGVIYAGNAVRHLRQQARRPVYRQPREVLSGAMYESWTGNRWFGNWLLDDCLTYMLARDHGSPVTTRPQTNSHVPHYEERLGMEPRRVTCAHFEELVFFRDGGHTADKRRRADEMRQRLTGGRVYQSHPGVMLLRGQSGAHRILSNEAALAERLAKRGFQIIDPVALPLNTIIDACGGARVVAGVEGSQLAHGMMVMPPDAALLVLQPPERVVSVLKMTTDRQGQTFAFVIGEGAAAEFTVSVDEVEKTIDLL